MLKMTIPPKAFLLDMDGVLYQGALAIPHAIEFMQKIQHLPHMFITNNPTLLPTQVADKLASLGFVKPSYKQIITSGTATADYLSSLKPNFSYFAIGAEGLHKVLQKVGRSSSQQADFVVIGEGKGINFDNIVTAINLVKKGARLISTNPDNNVDSTCNDEPCLLPGGGALVAPIQIATGVTPITIGKPYPLLYKMALQRLRLKAKDCMMIGDRPDTDIVGAIELGLQTALVRTGRFSPADVLDERVKPDYDVEDLNILADMLGCEY